MTPMTHPKFNPLRLTSLFALTVGVAGLSAGCDRRVDTDPVAVTPPVVVAPAPAVVTPAPEAIPPAAAIGALPAAAGADVKVADIASNWTNYSGKTVTVVADVEEVKSGRAFTLDEDSALSGGVDNDLLVLSPKAGALANIDDGWLNNKVRVTGTVHQFVTADIEREIGWNLDPGLAAEFDGKRPVLIASAIERVR